MSLIAVAQGEMIRKGIISAECTIGLHQLGKTDIQIDNLVLDDGELGFDSLSLLSLVSTVNQFFNLHQSGIEDYLLVKRRIGDWVDLISQHFDLCGDNVSFSFQTSGSLGAPQTITHLAGALRAEISGLISGGILPLQPGTRIISLVPPHHIYGFLFSCLLPTIAGLALADLHRLPPTSALRKASSGDLIVATPYIWDHLATAKMRFRCDIHGISSGGPSTQATWSLIEDGGLSTLTEIYGATETGGVGFRKVNTQDFMMMPHLARKGNAIWRKDVSNAPLALQDHVDWTGKRSFRISGRRDNAIQIAGVNVSLDHVADVIGSCAGVRGVHVRFDDEQIKAFVVPANGDADTGQLADAVRAHISTNLDPVARPAEIRFGPEAPRNAMGKLRDWSSINLAE